jgi:hypothetical protein
VDRNAGIEQGFGVNTPWIVKRCPAEADYTRPDDRIL